MSLSSSLYAGLSGMTSYGSAMAMVGDNLANTNTTGFKSSTILFSDIIAMNIGNNQIGRGNKIEKVSQIQSQGSFQSTNSTTDVAIEGNGYFVVDSIVSGASGSTGTRFYTRAGSFIQDKEGYLVDRNGYYVQGYTYDTTTRTFATSPSSINLSTALVPPQDTTTMTLGLNLGASASAGTTFQASLTTYNSLGEPVTLTLTFVKQSTAGTWNWSATSSIGTTTSSGTLTFNSTGDLIGSAQPAGGTATTTDPTITITGYTSGAADQTITWDLFSATGTTNGDVTQYDGASYLSRVVQDGFAQGNLIGVTIDNDGIINGTFSNGVVQQIAQLALAKFASLWYLERVGGTMWRETQASGQGILGKANTEGFGSVLGSTLEMSTVDMATEFTNMIQFQRAYQSSSKVITTTDQMLQDAINLVR